MSTNPLWLTKHAPSGSRLWMYLLPGLTPEMIMEESREVGILPHAQMNSIAPRQWDELRLRCLKRVTSGV